MIKQIRDGDDMLLTEHSDIAHGFWQHFTQVFLLTRPSKENIAHCLSEVEQIILEDMRLSLEREFLREEVEIALKQMSPFKPPGPNGFNVGFCQDHWEVIGTNVSKAMLDFLNNGLMATGLNHTHISLVPKVNSPTSMHEFRPINLCNVLYKLISKVLANRMKGVLSKVISWNQCAFIPSRLITNNIMVAYELLHTMQSRQKSKVGNMTIKLGMSKAYDRVKLDYLEAMLVKLEFGARWTGLLMTCVKTVSYSVKINGSSGETIYPSRGLHQGDPLSSYLFLICAKGLTYLFQQAENKGIIRGIAAAKGGIQINHLLFASECVIFCRAKQEE